MTRKVISLLARRSSFEQARRLERNMTMSETEISKEVKPASAPKGAAKASFADTVVDIGLSWAEAGIGISKTALENSARALDRTAKHLEGWKERLKGTARPAAAEELVDEITKS